MAYTFKSKAMQAIQSKKIAESSVSATEIAKIRVEVERLKRTVETLTGVRGTGADKAVLTSTFEEAVESVNKRLIALGG